jgi:type II secretory pathway pseudopilin PulG
MKSKLSKQNCKAITRKEVIAVIAVLVIGAMMILPELSPRRGRAQRSSCINNLKQIAIALRIWSEDNTNRYPMQIPVRDGGTLELINGPETFRHFQAMANEVGQNPRVFVCPEDAERKPAESFERGFNNNTLSYFIGIDIVQTNLTMLAVGDRNLSDSEQIKHGLVAWSTKRTVKWTKGLHTKEGIGRGNILLGDGGVKQVTSSGLQSLWQNTGVPTNRLALP